MITINPVAKICHFVVKTAKQIKLLPLHCFLHEDFCSLHNGAVLFTCHYPVSTKVSSSAEKESNSFRKKIWRCLKTLRLSTQTSHIWRRAQLILLCLRESLCLLRHMVKVWPCPQKKCHAHLSASFVPVDLNSWSGASITRNLKMLLQYLNIPV